MSFKQTLSFKRLSKQKRLWTLILISFGSLFLGVLFFMFSGNKPQVKPKLTAHSTAVVSEDINQDNLRIAELEKQGELYANELEYMKSKLVDLAEEKTLFNEQVQGLNEKISNTQKENGSLKQQLKQYQIKQAEKELLEQAKIEAQTIASSDISSDFTCWTTEMVEENEDEKSIKYVIPPGTLVKGIIVQGVSQAIGVNKPADPEVALIRIISAGKLPKKLRMALKGSNLICSTEGNLSNRRVRVRGETMSKHKKNGTFVVTNVSAVISGPGGKAGVPARVISHGGVQAGYAGVSSALGAATTAMQGVLNNQYITQLAQTAPTKTILNATDFTNVGAQGLNGGFDKLTDYYIKMADLYSPVLEIDMGTEVSILFTTAVTIGDKNIKKKIESERAAGHEAYIN